MKIQILILKLCCVCLMFLFSACPFKNKKTVDQEKKPQNTLEPPENDKNVALSKNEKIPVRKPGSIKNNPNKQKRKGNQNKILDQHLAADEEIETQKRLNQEFEKSQIDKEIKNSVYDMQELHAARERINDKIENFNKAIPLSKHTGIFFKLRNRSIRPVMYWLLCSRLEKAGLTPEDIEQIKSTEDIQQHLEAARKDLKEIEQKLKEQQYYINDLTNQYAEPIVTEN